MIFVDMFGRIFSKAFRKVLLKLRYRLARKKLLASGRGAYSESDRFDVVVYFPDKPDNLYQLRQWYAPLEELAASLSVAVLVRHPITFEHVSAESRLRLLYVQSMADYEAFCLACNPKLLLYVNHNRSNLSSMQIRSALTVYLCHGESEKPYMTWGQVRAYDFHLIAGQAAYQRLSRAMPHYDVAQRTIVIGRPQADAMQQDESTSVHPTVLYAPTREGDRHSMALSSVLSLGQYVVELLFAKGYRVIYRPHPCIGVNNSEYRLAHRRIVECIAKHNRGIRDPARASIYDDSPTIDWQIEQSRFCITDLSAFGLDYLASAKPIILLLPTSFQLPAEEVAYAQATYIVYHEQRERLAELVNKLPENDDLQSQRREIAEYYYQDLSQRTSTRRFILAIEDLIRYQESEHRRLAELRQSNTTLTTPQSS